MKSYLPALRYIVLGPLIFWVPSVFLHLLRGYRFSGIETITLGIWLFGPVMMSVSASNSGGGFSRPDGLHFVLVGTCVFPVFTFIMSTYDGTLGALLITSVLLPLMSALSGRAKQA